MNFSDFITHHGKKVHKENFIHLIQIARIDGKISPAELELLHKDGRKFGLTDPEIDKLLKEDTTHNYLAPYSLKEKFEELYNIAQMVLADEVVTSSERHMLEKVAIAAGFSDATIEKLVDLLFEGIKNGESEETLLHEFRKKHLNP
jgi:uncharacterized tellurite resistance protein B-like protein